MQTFLLFTYGKSGFSVAALKALRKELRNLLSCRFYMCVCVFQCQCEADYLFALIYFTAHSGEFKLYVRSLACAFLLYNIFMHICRHTRVCLQYKHLHVESQRKTVSTQCEFYEQLSKRPHSLLFLQKKKNHTPIKITHESVTWCATS